MEAFSMGGFRGKRLLFAENYCEELPCAGIKSSLLSCLQMTFKQYASALNHFD